MLVQPDGSNRLDVAKMVERAIQLGQTADIAWQQEEQQVHPHPIQTPPPEQSK
jgi:hypothetical protein